MQPAEEYRKRSAEREALSARFEQIHIRLGNVRLLLAIVAALAIWLGIYRHLFSGWWFWAPVGVFVAVAIHHAHILQRKASAERAIAVYRHGLARIEDRWAGMGQTGDRFNDPHHVYAADLDLFGAGGLFDLLSTCRSRMGEDTLAKWLLAPANVVEIRERHAAVAELAHKLDLREDLAVLGGDARVGVHPEALIQWAEAPNQLNRSWIRLASLLLALCAIGGAVVWGVWGLATPFIAILLVEGGIVFAHRKQLEQILHGAEHQFADLELLSSLLERIEREKFSSPRLQALTQQLSSHHLAGSAAIARLRTIVEFIHQRDNVVIKTVDIPLLYSIQVAYAAEAWRREHGAAVRRWLHSIGEIEALLSIASYHHEHPDDPFPEFSSGPACFKAEELGHPLLAAAKCVRNSVEICGDARVLLISGSNMSGKSTLLRAVGINTVLAMAGAPVRARLFQLTPLRVGASIRVNDSLQEGSSRFYAEITRLRKIFDLAQDEPPLIVLLDELLQGTNSKDRRVGAEGVVNALLKHGAIGLISTHDLALTDVAAGRARNVHFEDEFQNGQITFDYRLREGVVTKSNGLELMRSIGLDV